MPEVKVGDILFLKTTGEPVQVLRILDNGYDVRRPIVTKDEGIKHIAMTVFSFEVETEGEKYNRDLHNDYLNYSRQMKLVEMTQKKEPELSN